MTLLRRHPARALVAAAIAVLTLVLPATAHAGDPREEREDVRRKQAAAAADIDALRASDAEVEAALETLNSNVAAQEAALVDARRRAAQAEAALAEATELVNAKEAEIAELHDQVESVAVAAFVRPPNTDSLLDSLGAETLGEAELKQSLLQAKSSNQFDVLDQLERARQDLETARSEAEAAAAAAAENRAAVDAKLAEVRQAQNEQQQVAADVENRLDRRLSEAAALEDLDAELSAEIKKEQERLAALAAQAAANRRAREASSSNGSSGSSGSSGNGGGGATTISITGSGSIVSVNGIRVHQSIAGQLRSMLSAASSAGINLSGGGYRSPTGQIQTRRNNCGSSNYAVYQMPAGSCSPPTARPGTSMHERGLAVDFTYQGRIVNSRSSAAFQWLAANAAGYGFYNLPSEPWHWSVNGN
ncbi:MAG: M15 family metallopeptidase [Acidimicrobiales bacterium]|nr:M15 family metallopeptidase [Acidimicrobiales bacterium]